MTWIPSPLISGPFGVGTVPRYSAFFHDLSLERRTWVPAAQSGEEQDCARVFRRQVDGVEISVENVWRDGHLDRGSLWQTRIEAVELAVAGVCRQQNVRVWDRSQTAKALGGWREQRGREILGSDGLALPVGAQDGSGEGADYVGVATVVGFDVLESAVFFVGGLGDV